MMQPAGSGLPTIGSGIPMASEEDIEEGVGAPFLPNYKFAGPAVGFMPPRFTRFCDAQQRQRFGMHAVNVGKILLTPNCLITLVLAETALFLCRHYKFEIMIHVAVFITVVVFPLAFSINTVFQRRDRALDDLALLKSAGLAWFLLHQEWHDKLADPQCAKMSPAEIDAMKNDPAQYNALVTTFCSGHLSQAHDELRTLFKKIRLYLTTPDWHYAYATGDENCKDSRVRGRNQMLQNVFAAFQKVSACNERLRMGANAAAHIKVPHVIQPPIIARLMHWTFFMIQSFEKLRGIREYRSPVTIRSFTKTLTFVGPIGLTPYFSYLAGTYKSEWIGYALCAFISFAFTAMTHVQGMGENVFGNANNDTLALNDFDIDEWRGKASCFGVPNGIASTGRAPPRDSLRQGLLDPASTLDLDEDSQARASPDV
eukprot:TRINITY_DN3370_c0_g1_i3.p1 TRINITY_DN3370_c0_g1~~TRINITY_DN3370_c0_g1_i3.p1  ORF type:complete len:427 (+),score=96.89 TRINITY_DN3370_c0_g1_i3:45-1325(+)